MNARPKLLISLLGAITVSTTAAWAAPRLLAGSRAPVLHLGGDPQPGAAPSSTDARLRVMSLNMAHGRGEGRFQALQRRAALQRNLDSAGALLRQWRPDAVALQEADRASWWSGRFDHVAHLAQGAQLPWRLHSAHVDGMGLHYGTGLLTRIQPLGSTGHSFAPSPPTMSKGFTRTVLMVAEQEVELVSVHLDFSRAAVRQRQARELVKQLTPRTRPLVLMGDFNCQWNDAEDSLRAIAAGLDLEAWRPDSDAEELVTFPSWDRRLDWILVSPEWEFLSYRVLPEPVSDHRVLLADLRLHH